MLFAALHHVLRLEISLRPLLIPIIVIWFFSIIVITNVGCHTCHKTLLLISAHTHSYHIMPYFAKDVLVNVSISLITAIFYNKIITNGYCFDPHLPQNFAAGFSLVPQLLQDEDVSLISAGFRVGFSPCLRRY